MVNRWSKREVAILIKRFQYASWTELKQLFPGRTQRSIENKAEQEKLTRPGFATKDGIYHDFARCPEHGMVRKEKIIWEGKHLNIPKCPIIIDKARALSCKRRLTLLPRRSKLREKYRV